MLGDMIAGAILVWPLLAAAIVAATFAVVGVNASCIYWAVLVVGVVVNVLWLGLLEWVAVE